LKKASTAHQLPSQLHSFQDTQILYFLRLSLLSLITMKLTLLAATALACSTASAYTITADTVNCRIGPGTSYAVKKTYAKGHDVSISCQAPGTNVDGDSLWDKTSDDCYVADYYVKTGSSGYVTSKCSSGSSGGSGSCAAPKSNTATVNLIAEFEGFVPHVCK
jgi:lysozyme